MLNIFNRLATRLLLLPALIVPIPAPAFDYFQPLPERPLVAKDNPQTRAKIRLGKKLFYDTRLSRTNTHSCNTCHNLLTGGDDDRAKSISPDGDLTKRSAPGLWNIGLQTVLFWDGRVPTLEIQAEEHLLDKTILGNTSKTSVIKRLAGDAYYVKAFKDVFGGTDALTLTNIARALASFERELMSPNSAFDRYLRGDENAISEQAKQGQVLFQDVGCSACHFGVNFAGPAPGPALNKMGDGFYELFPTKLGSKYDKLFNLTDDIGRYAVTGIENEKYMWRVPPLRNIALTGPYFHNGSAKTLRQAIRVMGKVQFDNDLTEEQISAIEAFLNTLTGEVPGILSENAGF